MHILKNSDEGEKQRIYGVSEQSDEADELVNIEDEDGFLWFDEVFTVRRESHRNSIGYTEQEVETRVFLTI